MNAESSEPRSTTHTDEHVLTVMMQKYSLLKQEAWQYIAFYKTHIKNLQLIGTLVIAIIGFVLTHQGSFAMQKYWSLWAAASFFLSVTVNFLLMHTMDALYQLILGLRVIVWVICGHFRVPGACT